MIDNFIELIQLPVFKATFVLGMMIHGLINYSRVMNRFVGFRNMRFALFGWYKVPGEELRIFLFNNAFRKINDYYQVEYINKPLLRGKQETLAIYAINLPPKNPEQIRPSTTHQVVHSPSQNR